MIQAEHVSLAATRMRALARETTEPHYAQMLSRAAQDLEEQAAQLERMETALLTVSHKPKVT